VTDYPHKVVITLDDHPDVWDRKAMANYEFVVLTPDTEAWMLRNLHGKFQAFPSDVDIVFEFASDRDATLFKLFFA
jgi:hypothetical protein